MEGNRLWAANELIRDRKSLFKGIIGKNLIKEALNVMIEPNTSKFQKKAARIILNNSIGIKETSRVLKGEAIIKDRGDPLVRMWMLEVKDRDNNTCVECGAKENIHVHHISHWSDDIYNRINVDNGVCLCKQCHSTKHPENPNFILSIQEVRG